MHPEIYLAQVRLDPGKANTDAGAELQRVTRVITSLYINIFICDLIGQGLLNQLPLIRNDSSSIILFVPILLLFYFLS